MSFAENLVLARANLSKLSIHNKKNNIEFLNDISNILQDIFLNNTLEEINKSIKDVKVPMGWRGHQGLKSFQLFTSFSYISWSYE